jgi:hypothetical protein
MLGRVFQGRGGDVVDIVVVVRIGEFLGCRVSDLGQNERGERGRLGGC